MDSQDDFIELFFVPRVVRNVPYLGAKFDTYPPTNFELYTYVYKFLMGA